MKKTYIFTIVLILIFVVGSVFYRMTYVPQTPPVPVADEPVATSTDVIPEQPVSTTTATSTKPVTVVTTPKVSLSSKTWVWAKTTYSDGKIVVPNRPDRFKLTFTNKGFSASTDCNGVGGEYGIKGNQITFDRMMSTLMYCEGSQEGEFAKMLSEVKSYHVSSNGELVFDLKVDSGVMVFK